MRTGLSLVLALASTGALAAAAPRAASAQDCEPARAMVILDKSSSMQTGTIGGVTKWEIAKGALDTVVTQFETSLELGLMVFPNPDQCAPGVVEVDPALNSAQAIRDELATPPPTGGNWTPISETLAAAAESPALATGDVSRYAILITDGWQWCDPYDPDTRLDAVGTIEGLNSAGVTTYVVGFGGAVDAMLLNQVAVAAGTALPGCDPTGDTPDAANPCYYQADDPGELLAALMEIATSASEETCDGVDNDCDGKVDEDLTRACDGGCGGGTQTCAAGAWGECSASDPTQEACDGVDNDCDGQIDEPSGGDDVGGGLCGDGLECTDGTCQPPDTTEPPAEDEPDNGGMSAGCGCGAGASGGEAAGWLLSICGVLLALGRRRRSHRL